MTRRADLPRKSNSPHMRTFAPVLRGNACFWEPFFYDFHAPLVVLLENHYISKTAKLKNWFRPINTRRLHQPRAHIIDWGSVNSTFKFYQISIFLENIVAIS